MTFVDAMIRFARRLEPGCFALVMATGIVSIDASQHELPLIARALFAFNLLAFAWLMLLFALRLGCFSELLRRDLHAPARGIGLLTLTAGSCVLGSQSLLLVHWPWLAWMLLALGAAAWLVLGGALLPGVAALARRGRFLQQVHGGWLIAVVATQGLSVLASLLGMRADGSGDWLHEVSIALFLLGLGLYLPIIALILWRFARLSLQPRDLTPPYWITMGALAISTLAGSLLVQQTLPAAWLTVLRVGTWCAWLGASAWIAPLVGLWLWRSRHLRLRHSREDWDIVFPLGMYTVGTFEFARAFSLPGLLAIPAAGVYVSLLAWSLVAAGALHHGLRATHRLRRQQASPAPRA